MIHPPARTGESATSPAPRRRTHNLLRGAALVTVVALIGWQWHRARHRFEVDWVMDGDTFVVDYHGTPREVQLAGADAPELHKDEPFADVALKYLREKLEHQRVWLEFLDDGDKLDYKHRLLCWVWVGEVNINYLMVGQGYARFSGAAEDEPREVLLLLEEEARQMRRGLWNMGWLSSPGP